MKIRSKKLDLDLRVPRTNLANGLGKNAGSAIGKVITINVINHDNGNATTADFVATAERVSGQELSAFFDAWLYGTTRPPLPGG